MKPSAIIVLVGITGDLSKRKLLPALEKLGSEGALPESFMLLGVSRREVSVDSVLEGLEEKSYLKEHAQMLQMDLDSPDDYSKLRSKLAAFEADFASAGQTLFFLSVAPDVSMPIIAHLGDAGLSTGDTKLLLEKPTGTDLLSARELIEHTAKYFSAENVYRIDHYLFKEAAQRLPNFVADRKFDGNSVESVEILASEKMGIEGRADFYDKTGALRDLIQSHLLEMAALSTIDLAIKADQPVRELRLEALRKIALSSEGAPVRAQYEEYRAEAENPESVVETFASILVQSENSRWKGVPIRVTTGKALDKKATTARFILKNQKEPLEYDLSPPSMPEAYELVFRAALAGKAEWFVSSDEVLELWRIVEPVLEAWKSGKEIMTYSTGASATSVLNRAQAS